jgi:2-oxoisovalerate dehydrogenase E1 component
VVLDEDVPGGASAYIVQKVVEEQGGSCGSTRPRRRSRRRSTVPAYGSDGDFFSKPGVEDVFEAVYALMHEFKPSRYPRIG